MDKTTKYIKQHKTRNDAQGRCYYQYQCPDCKGTFECRSDRISNKKHECRVTYSKVVKCRKKDILRSPAFEIRITAISKAELNKMLEIHLQQYEILN